MKKISNDSTRLIKKIPIPQEIKGVEAFLSYAPLNIAFHAGRDNQETIEYNRSLCITPFNLSSLAYLNQVHGKEILEAKNGGLLGNGDGILITQKNLIGLIMVADCNPILLFDNKHQVLVLLHGGRASLQKNIIPNALQQMQTRFHTNSSDLFVYVGPSIRACCYEVGQEIFTPSNGTSLECGKILREGKIYLDLTALIKSQLQNANITNYIFSPHCTCCTSGYFSYRKNPQCGRFGLFAYLI